MGIITNDELKTWLGVDDDNDDARIVSATAAANSAIVNYCGRSFDKVDVGDETPRAYTIEASSGRFTWPYRQLVEVDDFWDITNLAVKTDQDDDGVYETVWAASDYVLEPLNGLDGPLAVPYWRISAVASRRFPTYGRRPALQVTAAWGWAAVPDDVKTATLIKAARLFKRKDSPEGILGGWVDGGTVRVTQKEDPDALALLRPYRRVGVSALIG